MIEIPLNHLLLISLGGVALGVLITLALTGKSSPKTATRSAARIAAKPVAKLAPNAQPEDSRTYLNRCVMQRRSLTIDKTAQMLGVTPRRIRRFLDDGILIAVPTTDGPRRVNAVSIHDFLTRRQTMKEIVSSGEPARSAGEPRREPMSREPEEEEPEDKPKPKPAKRPKLVPPPEEEEEDAESEEGPEGESAEQATGSDRGEDDGYDYEGEKNFMPRSGQKYWYYIEGIEHPFRSLRAALQALNMPLAQTSWEELPNKVRSLITRRKV